MPYRLPAEWEPQEFVLLTWPHATTDWAPYLQDIRQTMTEMALAIARHEKVVILSMFRNDVPDQLHTTENVMVVELPNNDTWARDFGPIVLKRTPSAEGSEGPEPTVWLDFRFNGWGEKFLADWDNQIPKKLWESLALAGKQATKTIRTSCSKVAPLIPTGRARSSPPRSACWRRIATSR